MINEERVKHMTRMAIFEKEKAPEYQSVLKYTKKEYVALHGWGGFFAGTIIYWVLYVLAIIYFMGEVIENLSMSYIAMMVLIGFLCYAAYIIMHVYTVRHRAMRNYKQAKKLTKELGSYYTKLVEMYEAEKRESTPKQVRTSGETMDYDNM